LVALAGLVLDGGMVYQVKRREQSAADAAALGGAQELWRGNTSLVVAAARTDSAANGFTHEVNNTLVEVNNPPLNGPRAGNGNFVEVIISREVPTTFLRVVNRNTSTVRSRAVAGLVNYADGCVLALDEDDRGALKVAGTSTLTSSCGVMVNSDDERAIEVEGGGCIYSDEVGVSGSWVANGSANCIYPPPTADLPPAMDPLDYLPEPPMPGLVATNFKMTGGVAVLSPGRYVGGIEISGGTVTFLPGTYYLDGGGLQITGNAVVTGTGVTFFNTRSSGGAWGDFQIAGTVQATFTAPDSGTYEGMLFWNDDNAPYRNVGSVIAGTSNSSFTGAMYFPSTHLTWAGTSDTSSWNMIVAKTITIAGNAVVNSDYDSTTIGVPTRKATLVE
jgi:hypothetical protein